MNNHSVQNGSAEAGGQGSSPSITRRQFIAAGVAALAGLSATQITGLAQVAAMIQEEGKSGREAKFRRFGIARRRPDISVEEFHYHWREIHGPLGMTALPKTVKCYVQNHSTARPIPGFGPSLRHCFSSSADRAWGWANSRSTG